MKIDLAFPDFISEGEAPETELPDAFGKFMEAATLAGTLNMGASGHRLVSNLAVASAERDKPIAAAYRKIFVDGEAKIAAESAKNNPPAPATSNTLKKFSSDEKAGYRKYFEEQRAAGKTASATLAEWLREFPNANPSIEKLMREVCAEFA